MTSYTINASRYVSPNFNSRPSGMAIDSIVIHTTEGVWDSDAEWLCNGTSQASTHYIVPPSGSTIYQLVTLSKRAWHAGVSEYGGRSDWNNFSIGVEISHKEGQAWAAGQKDRTAALCKDLIATYHVPQANVVAHRWVASPPGRKHDPTDWPDDSLNAWIAGLYAPAYVRYTVLAPCTVLQAPVPDAPLATGPNYNQTWLMPGTVINVGSIDDGWAHVAPNDRDPPGIGFLPAAYVRPV